MDPGSPEAGGVPFLPNLHGGLEQPVTLSLPLRGGQVGRCEVEVHEPTAGSCAITHRLVPWVSVG